MAAGLQSNQPAIAAAGLHPVSWYVILMMTVVCLSVCLSVLMHLTDLYMFVYTDVHLSVCLSVCIHRYSTFCAADEDVVVISDDEDVGEDQDLDEDEDMDQDLDEDEDEDLVEDAAAAVSVADVGGAVGTYFDIVGIFRRLSVCTVS